MTSVLMATYPEVFAGGAVIAGLPYAKASTIDDATRRMKGQDGAKSARALASHVLRASPGVGSWPIVSVWRGDLDETVELVTSEGGHAVAIVADVRELDAMTARNRDAESAMERSRNEAEARVARMLADAEERSTSMVSDARATADRVLAESERELAAAAQRRDSINAQLSNVRQMLATLSGTGVPGVAMAPSPVSEEPVVEAEPGDSANAQAELSVEESAG